MKNQIEQTLSSLEVAQMIRKQHKNLLADIRGYAEELNELKIQPVDFFQEDTYIDRKGEVRPCYKITKKGCEFVAHKLIGLKGTEFTAKYINRFHDMEEIIKEGILEKKTENKVQFKEIIEVIPLIAQDLNVNNISRLIMYKDLCKDYNVPTNFLPSYIDNGDREKKSATELLKQFQCGISARQFNILMLKAGYLEERERKSTSSKTGVKKFKVLTEKGKEYGENQTAEQNAKETQPLYFVDTFQELFDLVMQEVA